LKNKHVWSYTAEGLISLQLVIALLQGIKSLRPNYPGSTEYYMICDAAHEKGTVVGNQNVGKWLKTVGGQN
jgi:hypothetical protein